MLFGKPGGHGGFWPGAAPLPIGPLSHWSVSALLPFLVLQTWFYPALSLPTPTFLPDTLCPLDSMLRLIVSGMFWAPLYWGPWQSPGHIASVPLWSIPLPGGAGQEPCPSCPCSPLSIKRRQSTRKQCSGWGIRLLTAILSERLRSFKRQGCQRHSLKREPWLEARDPIRYQGQRQGNSVNFGKWLPFWPGLV